MDERSLILNQLDMLNRRLFWVEQVLDGTKKINLRIHEQSSLRFEQLISARQREIKKLRKQIQLGNEPPEEFWKQLNKNRESCKLLFGESLAYLGGLLVRDYYSYHQIFSIADGLCEYLCKKTPVKQGLLTIPAVEDSFSSMTNMIRVRFPDFSVWSLPVVAHELGHYVESERRGTSFPYDYSKILEKEGQGIGVLGGRNELILIEQFADLFAVFALGPAYACMYIILSSDPRLAYASDEVHPSDAERVYFILNAHSKMRSRHYNPFSEIINPLKDLWDLSLQTLGMEPIKENKILDYRVDAMYEIFNNEKNKLSGVLYEPMRWITVHKLRDDLVSLVNLGNKSDSWDIEFAIERKLGKYETSVELPDVINAAWLFRLEEEGIPPDEINQVALSVCQRLLAK